TFQLYENATFVGMAAFPYIVGSSTKIFYNPTAITINDNTNASPYPSGIAVSNVGTYLIKATVTLTNMNHPSPKDINVLVVAPNQKDTLLMSHAGNGNALNHVNLTFDDAAT